MYCGYAIQPLCADSVVLVFESFDMEDNFDSVYVYDGTDITGTLLGGFTGNVLPPALTAQSGSMYILLVSDNMIELSGFIATWTSAPIDWSTVSGAVTPATCSTCNDGAIDVTSGTSDLFYSWSNSMVTEDISGLLPGDYSVTITTQSGCDTTYLFTVTSLDGIFGSDGGNNYLNVYPNPVESDVFVEWNFSAHDNVLIELTDVFGRVLYSSEESYEGKLKLNMDLYAKGVYLIRCRNAQGEKIRRIEIVD
ncbi:CUB domain protein [anaerobic digester metagenome]